MRPNPMYRQLLLSNEIDSASVTSIIKSIMEINHDDNLKEKDYIDWVREPIELFINTNGGNAYDALALIDIIQTSKTPIHTIALGWCMSAGLWIFMSGHKRLIGKNATLMFHDVATWAIGKTEQIKQELAEATRLAKMYKKIIVDNSDVTDEQLQDYINRKAEWYIPAEEARNLNMANGFYA